MTDRIHERDQKTEQARKQLRAAAEAYANHVGRPDLADSIEENALTRAATAATVTGQPFYHFISLTTSALHRLTGKDTP